MAPQNTFNQMPLRPAQHTEQRLITAILDGTYPPGSVLPAERGLAEDLGVTRPTIREALQRLAAEGWVTIHHGKPTKVNDYWDTGGLGLLGTLVKYSDLIPDQLILHLLDFRVVMLPPVARYAAQAAPERLSSYLQTHYDLPPDAAAFARYDWQLQELMAKLSGNPIYPLILNDFRLVFDTMGTLYFQSQHARQASTSFYDSFFHAIKTDAKRVEHVVRRAMEESIAIYKQINPSTKEIENATMERLGR